MALKILGTLLLIAITSGAMLLLIGTMYVSKNLNTDMAVDLNSFPLNLTTTVYYYDAADNRVKLEVLYEKENREWADFQEIPGHMIDALIAIEDKRFYTHRGVDWWRTVSAFTNLFSDSKNSFGGSTITQQLIKNMTGNKEVTVKRKLTEIFVALECEKQFKKEDILLLYLNTCYFGQGSYGVKVAARTYFNKELDELSLAESASIIGITNAPTHNDPFVNPENNKKRQEVILNAMLEQGLLTEAEYRKAVNEKLEFVYGNRPSERDIQSYFVDQVYRDVAVDLAEKNNITLEMAKKLVLNGGLQIDTTIDMDIQAIMDDIFQNEENIPEVKGLDKPQAAMILMDPYTGAVLGMAGGVGEKEGDLMLNRAVKSVRQPGSSIKPVGVYAPALELGEITPYSVVDDSPFRKEKDRAWPRNSGGRYQGRTTVLNAVTNSVNTVAARVIDMITPEQSYRFLTEELGVTSLRESDIDYSPLALGGLTRGISVLELTAAYCIFPNGGEYIKPYTYTKVIDFNGNVILQNPSVQKRVLAEKNAWYMNTMLQNVVLKGTGSKAKLDGGMPAAGKTGTTTEDKDRWFVGYTPYYCGGVWFGFDEPKKIALKESTNPALDLWKQVMDRLHEGLEPREFFEIAEDKVEKASYCLDSGMKPSRACSSDPRGSRVSSGLFYVGDVPDEVCTMHTVVSRCAESGMRATSYCPNVTHAALLDFPRNMPIPGVYVEDESYRIHPGDIAKGFFAPASPGGGSPSSYCSLHNASWSQTTTDSENPDDTDNEPVEGIEYPDEPVDGLGN